MATNTLRAAPVVTLVLSFAVVLGIGWRLGPAPAAEQPQPPVPAPAGPAPTTPDAPGTASPSEDPVPCSTEVSSRPPSSSEFSAPGLSSAPPASPGTGPSGSTPPVPGAVVVAEPGEADQVHLGVVTAASRYRGSLHPTVVQTGDCRLRVCVERPAKKNIKGLDGQDWVQIDPPREQWCTFVAPGTNVDFGLVPR